MDIFRYSTANPVKRFAVESEEKARPAYEKALRPFHRLRAFSELVEVIGFEPTKNQAKSGKGEGESPTGLKAETEFNTLTQCTNVDIMKLYLSASLQTASGTSAAKTKRHTTSVRLEEAVSQQLRTRRGRAMYQRKTPKDIRCPVERGMDILGGK